MEQVFSMSDMVAFGNHLLSDNRNEAIQNKENLNKVHDSDIFNFLTQTGKITQEDE